MLRWAALLRALVARDNSAAPLSGLWAGIFDLLHSPGISRENFDQIFGAGCYMFSWILPVSSSYDQITLDIRTRPGNTVIGR